MDELLLLVMIGWGGKISLEFLDSLKADNEIKDKVSKLVANHMAPSLLYEQEVVKGNKITDSAIRRLAQRIYPASISDLAIVAAADYFGRGVFEEEKSSSFISREYEVAVWLLDRAAKIKDLGDKNNPMIRGRDLIDYGFSRPSNKEEGFNFSKAIELSDRLRALFEELSLELEEMKDFKKEEYFSIIKESNNIIEAVSLLKNKGIELVQKIRELRNRKIEK